MKNILVVDDDNMNRIMVKRALNDQYDVAAATSGAEAIKYLDTNDVDLILMDIEMPEMNGIETTRLIKSNNKWANIPIVFLTSDSDPITESECLKLGADDFIVKPVVPMVMNGRISRILELYDLRNGLETQLEKKTRQVELVTINAIMSIANTIDAKDKYTSGHSVRVAKCSVEIARRLGWSESELQNLRYVALLHDIGKIGVPDSVLNKPGRLNDTEFAVIKKHPLTGGEILKDIHMIEHVQEGALFHHERYDGSGYPFGLKGASIPLCARIVGIADSYDAMTTNRVYRKKLTTEQVINEFEKGKGTQFDPNLSELFIKMIKEGFCVTVVYNDKKTTDEISAPLGNIISKYNIDVKNNFVADPLTGMYNRNYAETRINELISSGHKGTLFMLDLDNFKHINDSYGHITGDKTLKIFAEILKNNTNENDVICRIGGDEFLAFFTDMTEHEEAVGKAEKIFSDFNEQFSSPTRAEGFSVSMGIAIYPDDGREFRKLYKNADKSLYHVKNNGKNSYHIFGDYENSSDDDYEFNEHDTSADLNNVRSILEGKFGDDDTFMNVAYDEFENIYNFISRYVKRSKHPVETVLLTLVDPRHNDYPDVITLDTAMNALKTSVITSLRSSDVGTKYSSNQYIVILMDADIENGRLVAERVVEKFKKIYKENDIWLIYDIQELEVEDAV
jgi:diguanylate cyclase (GGDEF)-like protein